MLLSTKISENNSLPAKYKVIRTIFTINKRKHFVVSDESGKEYFLVLFKPFPFTPEKEKLFLEIYDKLTKIDSPTVLNPVDYFITDSFGLLYPKENLTLLNDAIPDINLENKGEGISLFELLCIFISSLKGMIETNKCGFLFGVMTPLNVAIDAEKKAKVFGGCFHYIDENYNNAFVEPFLFHDFHVTDGFMVYSFSIMMNMCLKNNQLENMDTGEKDKWLMMTDLTPPFLKNLLQRSGNKDIDLRPKCEDLLQSIIKSMDDFYRNKDLRDFYRFIKEINIKPNILTLELDSILDKLSFLPQKTKDFGVKIMNLQNMLININRWSLIDIAKWISENFNLKSEIKYISSALITAANTKCVKIPLYIILLHYLNPIVEEISNNVINYTFRVGKRNDPYPKNEGITTLIFLMISNNIIDHKVVTKKIRRFYHLSESDKISCLFFAWFAPFIKEDDIELYNEMYETVKQEAESDFSPEAIHEFYENFAEYSKDNFSFYRESLPKFESRFPILNVIRGDCPTKAYKILTEAGSAKIPSTIFEPSYLAADTMIASSYAALYASSKVFHRMQQTHNVYVEDDKVIRKLAFYGIAGGNDYIIDILQSHGFDAITGIMYAIDFFQNDFFNTVLRKIPNILDPNPTGKLCINEAAASNNIYVLFKMLALGDSPNSVQAFGWTPLHSAAEAGSNETIEILLKHPEIKVNHKDIWGKTPLMVAADNGNVEAVNILLSSNMCDVDATDDKGKTAMHYAAGTGCVETIKLLKRAGANINAKDKKGKTPLHTAAEVNTEATLYLLNRKKIDKFAVDVKGRSAYDYAKICHREDVIKILEDYAAKNKCTI